MTASACLVAFRTRTQYDRGGLRRRRRGIVPMTSMMLDSGQMLWILTRLLHAWSAGILAHPL